MNQDALFPVEHTVAVRCTVCGATRAAGEQKAAGCHHDQHRDGKRPAGCLNAHNPKTAELPF